MKKQTITADRLSLLTVTTLFAFICIGMITAPSQAAKGAFDGIECCINVLVPSLFPFMFLSSFSVIYGISERIGRLFSKITVSLFNLPSDAGVTILLSLVGGFPVGAVGINSLYKQGVISKNQAARMLCFCVNSGPGFLISVVGAKLYGNTQLGIILTAAQVFVSVFTGIILGLLSRKKEPLIISSQNNRSSLPFSDAFISACKSACSGTAGLCSMVVLFSCFTELAHFFLKIEPNSAVGIIFRCICEVTDGCTAIAENRLPIYFAAVCVGFGGLCVHFQIFSSLSDIKISKQKFLLARAAGGLLCGTVTYIICKVFPAYCDVFSNIEDTSPKLSNVTYCGSIALIISMIAFLVCTSGIFKENVEYNRTVHQPLF